MDRLSPDEENTHVKEKLPISFIDKKLWITLSAVLCTGILFYLGVQHIPDVLESISKGFWFLRPFIVGLIIAYIVDPCIGFIDDRIFGKIKDRKKSWILSIGLFCIILIAIIAVLLCFLIPQLIDSITTIAKNVGLYKSNIEHLLTIHNIPQDKLDIILTKIDEYTEIMVKNAADNSFSVGKSITETIISMILAVYILTEKKNILTGLKKAIYLVSPVRYHDNMQKFISKCHYVFTKFIVCEVVDALMVTIAMFIPLYCIHAPYSVLISLISGITNLIPTFGPIIGGIIGGGILFAVNPLYAIIFLILTFIVQAIDGYIVKPKFFGNSMGISGLWVLVAIVTGQRIAGMYGVLLAIPVSAIIKIVWNEWLYPYLYQIKNSHSALKK